MSLTYSRPIIVIKVLFCTVTISLMLFLVSKCEEQIKSTQKQLSTALKSTCIGLICTTIN